MCVGEGESGREAGGRARGRRAGGGQPRHQVSAHPRRLAAPPRYWRRRSRAISLRHHRLGPAGAEVPTTGRQREPGGGGERPCSGPRGERTPPAPSLLLLRRRRVLLAASCRCYSRRRPPAAAARARTQGGCAPGGPGRPPGARRALGAGAGRAGQLAGGDGSAAFCLRRHSVARSRRPGAGGGGPGLAVGGSGSGGGSEGCSLSALRTGHSVFRTAQAGLPAALHMVRSEGGGGGRGCGKRRRTRPERSGEFFFSYFD